VKRILLLPGDGIGVEVVAQAERVLTHLKTTANLKVEFEQALVGGAAIDAYGDPLPEQTLIKAKGADAVLLGAVGGPRWDHLAAAKRPEKGLLRLRFELDLFANLRPAFLFDELVAASTLKADVVQGLDLLIVRELTGGLYFGEPRGMKILSNGVKQAVNTLIYDENEIKRVVKVAFELAQKRRKHLCSVDKANVLEVSQLWREVVNGMAKDYPEVTVTHQYVDNAGMQLIRAPKQFDVMVTCNLFGDILSDCAAMLTGSIGMLPSASLNQSKQGLYEPVHGSAPDIAGKDMANPLATILSVALMLRYSLQQPALAEQVESAVKRVLTDGWRTADIAQAGQEIIGTQAMGDKVIEALQ